MLSQSIRDPFRSNPPTPSGVPRRVVSSAAPLLFPLPTGDPFFLSGRGGAAWFWRSCVKSQFLDRSGYLSPAQKSLNFFICLYNCPGRIGIETNSWWKNDLLLKMRFVVHRFSSRTNMFFQPLANKCMSNTCCFWCRYRSHFQEALEWNQVCANRIGTEPNKSRTGCT